MKLQKEHLKRLVKLKNGDLRNDDVDAFFTEEVLKKKLRLPLLRYWDTIESIYRLFNKRLQKDGFVFKELRVHQERRRLFLNTIFLTQHHKFMLLMCANPDITLREQDDFLLTIMNGFHGLKESEQPVTEETLPEIVHGLVHALMAKRVDPKNIHLKKIEALSDQGTIVFHRLSLEFAAESVSGISIIAGFQY